jgi:hypothetical protein
MGWYQIGVAGGLFPVTFTYADPWWMQRQDMQNRLSIALAMVDFDMTDGTNAEGRVKPSNKGTPPPEKRVSSHSSLRSTKVARSCLEPKTLVAVLSTTCLSDHCCCCWWWLRVLQHPRQEPLAISKDKN